MTVGGSVSESTSLSLSCEDDDSRFTLYSIHPSNHELEDQLSKRKEQLLADAQSLTDKELEVSNRVLLPYISQLMQLKSSLGLYLDYLEGSKAYISLGLDK